jgi:hypothetical protein
MKFFPNFFSSFFEGLCSPFSFGCKVRKFHHKRKTISATKLQIAPPKKKKKKPKNQKKKKKMIFFGKICYMNTKKNILIFTTFWPQTCQLIVQVFLSNQLHTRQAT